MVALAWEDGVNRTLTIIQVGIKPTGMATFGGLND